ncbi:MAG: hypothetical protein J6A21_05520, partial [Lentisphaeria bacterium]|nr:hypothetical protein [Lentisphaeria bacterium]
LPALWKKADTFVRFSIPGQATVAVNQTEVQLLYDKENLYISIRGKRVPEWDKSKEIPNPGLWKGNNFEIFFKEEGSSAGHFHIAIARKAETYLCKGGIEDKGNAKKIKVVWQDLSKYVFLANVTIPLSVLDLAGKELAGKKMRFNTACQDADVPGPKIVHSSYAALSVLNYHKADTWPVVEFAGASSDDAGKFRWHRNDAFRMNLIPNGDFAAAIKGHAHLWNYGKDTQRQETMLYAGSYMLSATNNAYIVATGGWDAAKWTVAGKVYTFHIRMRRQGNDGSFGLIQLAKYPDGKVKGKTYVAWGTPVSEEWHDYYFVTKIDPDLVQFAFYRKAADKTSKLEIAFIGLYEGKAGSFEIRKATADSMKLPVGDPIATPINIYGKAPEKKKILYIGNYTSGITNGAREFLEIVNGLNADYDCLNASAKDADIYYTTSEPGKIASAVEKNEYDLYVIGHSPFSGSIYRRIGKELSRKIISNVEKGAALVMLQDKDYGSFASFLKKYAPKKAGKDHFLKKSLPLEMFTLMKDNAEPLEDIRESSAGKGRIILLKTASSRMSLQLLNSNDEALCSVFPYENYTNAWYARVFHYAMRQKDVPLAKITKTSSGASVEYIPAPEKAILAWKVTSKDGTQAASGKTSLTGDKAEVAFDESKVLSGNYLFEAHLLNPSGAVLAYDNAVFGKKGPSITSLKKENKEILSKKGTAEISLEVKDLLPGMKICWAWEDFSGRILEKGTLDAGKEVKFSVPLKHAFTTLTKLDVRLVSGGRTLDRERMALIIPDCDRERLFSDFHMQAWGFGGHEPTSRFTAAELEKQSEKIGIRAYNYGDIYSALLAGKNVAFLSLGGSAFRDKSVMPQNRRTYAINTAKAREGIVKATQANARIMKKYGVLCGGQVDEAEYTTPHSLLEPDTTEENVEEYRRRMKKEFGNDITLFNKRTGSSYASFDELKPCFAEEARKKGNFGEYVLWREFNADRWIEAHRLSHDALKEVDPTAHYQLQNTYGQGVCSGNDYWKLHNLTGYDMSTDYGIYNSPGRTGSQRHTDEFLRSFHPDMIHRPYGGFSQQEKYAHYKPWRAALHRFAGYTHFCFSRNTWRLVHIVPFYNLTKYSALCSEVLRNSGLYDGLGKLCLEYKWAKRDIAVYYHHRSMYTAFLLGKERRSLNHNAGSPLDKYYGGRQNLIYLLENLQYQYDFVATQQVEKGILSQYKVLFMPSVLSLSDKEVEEIRAFLRNGGKVIADLPPNAYDELAMKREKGGLEGIEVLGRIFNDKDAGMCEKIDGLLRKGGIAPVLTSEKKIPGCEVMHFADGSMHLFGLLHDPYEVEKIEPVKVTFPVKGHVYNLRDGKYLGETDTVECRIPEAEGTVLGVYPYKAEALDVEMPSSVKAGSDLAAEVTLKTSGGKAGKHVFHFEVIPPSGEARFFMKRNVVAPGGKTSFVFRIAHNDPAGTWKLLVKDVLTGTAVVKEFKVAAN